MVYLLRNPKTPHSNEAAIEVTAVSRGCDRMEQACRCIHPQLLEHQERSSPIDLHTFLQMSEPRVVIECFRHFWLWFWEQIQTPFADPCRSLLSGSVSHRPVPRKGTDIDTSGAGSCNSKGFRMSRIHGDALLVIVMSCLRDACATHLRKASSRFFSQSWLQLRRS